MENISPLFVLLLGMGTVFFGLISLIVLTMLMSKVIGKPAAAKAAPPAAAPAVSAAPASDGIADRKLFDAVVAAAIATYMGNAPEGFRIRSIKKV